MPVWTGGFDAKQCVVNCTWIGQQPAVSRDWQIRYCLTKYRPDGEVVTRDATITVQHEQGVYAFYEGWQAIIVAEELADCLYELAVTVVDLPDERPMPYTSKQLHSSTTPNADDLRLAAAREQSLAALLGGDSILVVMVGLRRAFYLPYDKQAQLVRDWVRGTSCDAAFDAQLRELIATSTPQWSAVAEFYRRRAEGESAGTILCDLRATVGRRVDLHHYGLDVRHTSEFDCLWRAEAPAEELDELFAGDPD